MAATASEGTAYRRDLSAPEATVLMRGSKVDERQALKLALKELVAREVLRLVTVQEPRRIGPATRIHVLTRGPGYDSDVGRALQAVMQVYDDARPPVQQPERTWSLTDEDAARIRSQAENAASLVKAHRSPRAVLTAVGETLRGEIARGARAQAHAYVGGIVGVPVAELAAVVFRRYRRNGRIRRSSGYVLAVVLPALEERGFYAPERYRRLGFFGTANRWVLTQAGMAAKAELEARLTIGGSARRGHSARRLDGQLRALAGSLGPSDAVDTVFAALDAGVDKGWHDVHGD